MSISKAEHDELCWVYAGLLLFDDKSEITSDKINKIISASGNSVDGYYPEFFAKYLSSVDLNSFLNNVGSGAGASAGAAPAEVKEEAKPAAGKGKDAKKPEPVKAKEPEPEEDAGGFGGLFE